MPDLAEFITFAAVLILGVLAVAQAQPPRPRRSRDTGRRA